jgi:hypothetical protein
MVADLNPPDDLDDRLWVELSHWQDDLHEHSKLR